MDCQFCFTEHSIQVPCIHNNGTHPNDLLSEVASALNSVRDAIKAVGESAPNGRDYYVLASDAMRRATEEHESRVKHLITVRDELAEIRDHIQAVIDFRDESRNRRRVKETA